MGTHTFSLSRLFVLLLVLAAGAVAAGVVFSQAPGQKPPTEEEEKPKPKPKPGEEVEEIDPKPKTRKPIRVGDENTDPTPPKATTAPAPDSADLMAAFRNAKQPVVRDFFFGIAEPHDVVANKTGNISSGGVPRSGTFRVRPLEEFLDPEKPRFTGRLRLRLFQDNEWLDDKAWEPLAGDIGGIAYYEQIVVVRVEGFLAKNKPTEEHLRAAQTALTAALRFHESAREQGKRRGDGFVPLGAAVREKLLSVQVDQLRILTAVKPPDWDRIIALAQSLADTFNRPADQARIVEPLGTALSAAIESGASEDQVRRLEQIEALFPNSSATNAAREKFRQKAQEMFDRAKALSKTDTETALSLLRQAEKMFPRLPNLRDYRLDLENKQSLLRVGVRDLPRHLTPGLAFTDAEKQAVELMFESLVKFGTDADGNPRWLPGLTEGTPSLVPQGRQFQLGRDTFWSNDKKVTLEDVRQTVRLLRNPKWPGYSPAWANLVEDPTGGDPTRVTLTLRQGYLDPLSLMSFKVLPAEPWPNQPLTPADDQKFDAAPVGSGPYVFKQRGRTREGREFVSFTANPAYASRSGKFGLPAVREIQFFSYSAPNNLGQDLKDKKLDMVLDMPSREVAAVPSSFPWMRVQTMPNRRIWFLAVNHRKPNLDNPDLRRAIAHAIDREAILDAVFRPGPDKKVHRPLTGPFPPSSWACDPRPSYRPALATTLIKTAEQNGLKGVRLSLKYPNDLEVAPAMAALAKQVQEAIGVTLDLDPRPLHDLHKEVEITHNYDLAYYWYDYPGPTYWLWPMFDPQATGAGGTNFLGYQNDGDLESQFGMILNRREFGEVRKLTQTLHVMLFDKMPLIPLWQLDTHLLLHNELQATIGDPLVVFSTVDQWRFDKK